MKRRKRFELRVDVRGLVHWVNKELYDSAVAQPWCFRDTKAQLVVFFRKEEKYKYPTCFWCFVGKRSP